MTIRCYNYWNEAIGRTKEKEWFSYFNLLSWDINQMDGVWGICLFIFNFEINIVI